jgi:hypothetical protein
MQSLSVSKAKVLDEKVAFLPSTAQTGERRSRMLQKSEKSFYNFQTFFKIGVEPSLPTVRAEFRSYFDVLLNQGICHEKFDDLSNARTRHIKNRQTFFFNVYRYRLINSSLVANRAIESSVTAIILTEPVKIYVLVFL